MCDLMDSMSRRRPLFKPLVGVHRRDVDKRREEELARVMKVSSKKETQNSQVQQILKVEEPARLERKLEREEEVMAKEEIQLEQLKEIINQQEKGLKENVKQKETEKRSKFETTTKEVVCLSQYSYWGEELRRKEEEAKSHYEGWVQQALNQMTRPLFKSYAEQRHPDSSEHQAVLVRQLQKHHYREYVQQLRDQQRQTPGDGDDDDDASLATMWTRKDIEEFKERVRQRSGGTVMEVRPGETVTVRVPVREEPKSLVWEFATDRYDIAFGVFFEGAEASPAVVVPVYRRACHEEVFAGSHAYPGQGAYLLKFDNSYNAWRAKTVYFLVQYTC